MATKDVDGVKDIRNERTVSAGTASRHEQSLSGIIFMSEQKHSQQGTHFLVIAAALVINISPASKRGKMSTIISRAPTQSKARAKEESL